MGDATHPKEKACRTPFRRCPTTTRPSSRTSTSRRCGFITTSTTRPTWTRSTRALEGTEWADKPIEDVIRDLQKIPEDKRGAVRNNGGGHLNHTLFWNFMSPQGGGAPSGDLAAAIDAKFGSFDAFKADFKAAGVNQFGSGWAWLVKDADGLKVVSTANQDNPVTNGMAPLLGVDVWEHAYYLNYQNRRPDYLDAWWNVVDWAGVAQRFAA